MLDPKDVGEVKRGMPRVHDFDYCLPVRPSPGLHYPRMTQQCELACEFDFLCHPCWPWCAASTQHPATCQSTTLCPVTRKLRTCTRTAYVVCIVACVRQYLSSYSFKFVNGNGTDTMARTLCQGPRGRQPGTGGRRKAPGGWPEQRCVEAVCSGV